MSTPRQTPTLVPVTTRKVSINEDQFSLDVDNALAYAQTYGYCLNYRVESADDTSDTRFYTKDPNLALAEYRGRLSQEKAATCLFVEYYDCDDVERTEKEECLIGPARSIDEQEPRVKVYFKPQYILEISLKNEEDLHVLHNALHRIRGYMDQAFRDELHEAIRHMEYKFADDDTTDIQILPLNLAAKLLPDL